MIKYNLCFLFFLPFVLFSCHLNNNIGPEKGPDPDPLLINCWKHAHEEETSDDTKIYRPCDFMEFPPSRFRSTYTFKENNDCVFLQLAPNDAHYSRTGRWEYNNESGILLIKDEDNNTITTFAVIELAADKLVVRKHH